MKITERLRNAVSRFDVILVFTLSFCVLVVLMNEWNIVHGFAQFTSSEWTFLGVVFGGEIVTFSLYQTAKRAGMKVPNTFKAKHSYVKDLEADDERGQKCSN